MKFALLMLWVPCVLVALQSVLCLESSESSSWWFWVLVRCGTREREGDKKDRGRRQTKRPKAKNLKMHANQERLVRAGRQAGTSQS